MRKTLLIWRNFEGMLSRRLSTVFSVSVLMLAAEEDEDCDALWSMFDVNDLDDGIAQPKARMSLGLSETQTLSHAPGMILQLV